MWNKPSEAQLQKLPKLYETESVPLKEKIIHMHFFIGGSDWYAIEYCPIDRLFWGYAILNGDLDMSEFGLIPLEELASLKVSFLEVDRDLHWTPRKAIEVEEIRKAQGWSKEVATQVK